MKLLFNANVLCCVEQAVRMPMSAILAELESERGASLNVLRALVGAGVHAEKYRSLPAYFIDEIAAGKLIDELGIETCAQAVGTAMKAYIAEVSR